MNNKLNTLFHSTIIPRNLNYVYTFIKIILFSLLLTLTSCTALDLIKGVSGGGPSLDVETTVGTKEESVVGSIGNTQSITTESLSGGIITNNVEEVPVVFMLLMILGWLMPTPTEMFKSTKNFILSLFGRSG